MLGFAKHLKIGLIEKRMSKNLRRKSSVELWILLILVLKGLVKPVDGGE